MAEQTDKLRSKTKIKPLYIKKVQYVGITKLIERDTPNSVTVTEAYYPYRESTTSNKLHDLRRVAHRSRTIHIEVPATHEVHLAKSTMTDSIAVVGDRNIEIAAVVNLFGSTRTLIGRPSGSGIYIYGEGDNEAAYFVLTWKQVLPVPEYRNPKDKADMLRKNQARRERMRLPTENFCRVEDTRKVYYLQKATPAELATILDCLKHQESK